MLNDSIVEIVGDNTDNSMDIETSDNLLSFDGNNRDDLTDTSDDNIVDSNDSIRIGNSNDNDGDDGLISRGTSTTNNAAMDTQHLSPSDSWTPLQLCYGIPLFDEDVNADVTRKVFCFSVFFLFFF